MELVFLFKRVACIQLVVNLRKKEQFSFLTKKSFTHHNEKHIESEVLGDLHTHIHHLCFQKNAQKRMLVPGVDVLFALLAIIIAINLFTQILFFMFLARVDEAETSPGYSLLTLIKNMGLAFLTLGSSIANAFSTISAAAPTLLAFATTITILTVVAEVNTIYQARGMQVLDGKTTQYILPFYKNVILPIANQIRILWDSFACWYNTFAAIDRVLLFNLYDVIMECTIQQWSNIIESILNAFHAFGLGVVDWTANGFSEDFKWKPVFEQVGYATSNLSYPLTCACGDLFFVFSYGGAIVRNDRLQWSITHLLNAIYSVLVSIVTTLFKVLTLDIFTSPFYGCDPLLPPPDLVACIDERPPNFFPFFNLTAYAVVNFTQFSDEAIEQIFIEISLNPTQNIIPDFTIIVGYLVAALIHVIENIVYIVQRSVGLFVFLGTPPSDSHFLLRVKTYNVINYLFSCADAIDHALNQIDPGIAGNLGRFLSNIFKVFIQLLDYSLNLIKITLDDVINGAGGIEISDFIENYDYELFKDYLESASQALDDFASYINEELADLLRSLINVLAEVIDILVTLGASLKKKKRDVLTTLVTVTYPKWIVLKSTFHSLCISAGNLVRQFEIRPGCTPFRNPFNPLSFTTRTAIDGEFCAVGSLIEDFLYALAGPIEMGIDVVFAALNGDSITSIVDQLNPGSPLNIDQHIYNRYANFIQSVASILPNIFVYISTPVVSSCMQSPTNRLQDTLENALRLILFIVDVVVITLKAFAQIITGNLDFCPDVLIPLYNATIGRFVDTISAFLLLIDCIATTLVHSSGTSAFATFVTVLDTIFGRDGTFISGICVIFDVLALAVQLVYYLFTDPAQFFSVVGSAIVQVFECIGTFLAGFFTQVFDIISNFFGQFGDCTVDFFDQIGICLCTSFIGILNDGLEWICGENCIDIADACGSTPCYLFIGDLPTSCDNFASGNFGDLNLDSITDGFVDCADNIVFDFNRKKRNVHHYFSSKPRAMEKRAGTTNDSFAEDSIYVINKYSARQAISSALNGSSLAEEIMQLTIQYCNPLLAFGAPYDSSNYQNLLQNLTQLNVSQVMDQIAYSDHQLSKALRFSLHNQYKSCVASVTTARIVEKFVLLLPQTDADVMPKLWLYDMFQFGNFSMHVLRSFLYVVKYEYAKYVAFTEVGAFNLSGGTTNSSTLSPLGGPVFPSWFNWMYENDPEDDVFAIRFGWWFVKLADGFLYGESGNSTVVVDQLQNIFSNATTASIQNIFPTFLRFVRTFMGKNGVYELLKTASSTLTDFVTNYNWTLAKRTANELMQPEAWKVDPALYSYWTNFTHVSMPMIQNFTLTRRLNYMRRRMSQDNRAYRFMVAPLRFARRIQRRMMWNEYGRPQDWTNGLKPPNVVQIPPENSAMEYEIFVQRNKSCARDLWLQRMHQLNSSSEKRVVQQSLGFSNLAGVDLCVSNACLNCTWLERVVDDFVDLFYICVQETETPVVLDGSLVTSSSDPSAVVLPGYRPDFWSSLKRRSLLSSSNQEKRSSSSNNDSNQTIILDHPPSSSKQKYQRYPLRPSLSKEFMNHGTMSESYELQLILELEAIFLSNNNATNNEDITKQTILQKRLAQIQSEDARLLTNAEALSTTNRNWTPQSFLLDGFENLIQKLFNISLTDAIIKGMDAVLDRVESSGSGFLFYFRFVRRCNYIDNARCNVGRQGIGLWHALGITILVFTAICGVLAALAYTPFVGVFGTCLLGFIPTLLFFGFYPLLQSLAYFSSPNCATFMPLPIIPNCIADDAYVILRDTYSPCVNYDALGLPGLTEKDCPPAWPRCVSLSDFSQYINASSSSCPAGTIFADANERVFVDCSQAPYYFEDGTRNIMFLLKTKWPSLYDWVTTSMFAPIQSFLKFSFIQRMTTFDFGTSNGGEPTDTWHSCNIISTPNVGLTAFWFGIGAGFVFLVLGIILAGIIFVWALVLALTTFVAALIGYLTGYKMDLTQVDLTHGSDSNPTMYLSQQSPFGGVNSLQSQQQLQTVTSVNIPTTTQSSTLDVGSASTSTFRQRNNTSVFVPSANT